jgi:hypothetical protein
MWRGTPLAICRTIAAMPAAPTKLVAFLAPYPPEVRRLFLDGRSFLLRRLRPVVELHYDATTAVGAGFSYTGDLRGLFVNFAAFADHVTLVFMWGVKLKDRERRLRGEGKQVRHMRLASMETLHDPYVLDLIDQAAANAPRPEGKMKHSIVVKIYKGPKRRPAPAKTDKPRKTPSK